MMQDEAGMLDHDVYGNHEWYIDSYHDTLVRSTGPALRTNKKHSLVNQENDVQLHKLFSPLMHMNSHSV
jgi:hypothetical protein